MVNSVMSEGLRGMSSSYREMQKSAHDIAKANIQPGTPQQLAQTEQPTSLVPVSQSEQSGQSNLDESLIELRRQEQLFTANAEVVKVADQTLGSIIDVKT